MLGEWGQPLIVFPAPRLNRSFPNLINMRLVLVRYDVTQSGMLQALRLGLAALGLATEITVY